MEYNTSNYFFKTYRDLKLSLEAAKAKLKVLEKEQQILIYQDAPRDVKAVDPAAIKGASTPLPLIEKFEKIAQLSTEIANTKILISEFEKQLENLAEVAEDMAATFDDDLLLTVFNLRHIKGMKLKDIADETGYSFIHIRRINSQLNKKMSQN